MQNTDLEYFDVVTLFVEAFFDIHLKEDVREMRRRWEENYSEWYSALIEQNAYDKFCEGIDDPEEMNEAQSHYDSLFVLLDWMEKYERDAMGAIWRSLDRSIGYLLEGANPNIRYPHILDDNRADRYLRRDLIMVYDSDALLHDHHNRNWSSTHAHGHRP